jgi:hypothetical protein
VKNAAISKMSTALASWKVRLKKLIIAGKTFEEAKKSNPTLTENDYEQMRQELRCPQSRLRRLPRKGQDMGEGRCGDGGEGHHEPLAPNRRSAGQESN